MNKVSALKIEVAKQLGSLLSQTLQLSRKDLVCKAATNLLNMNLNQLAFVCDSVLGWDSSTFIKALGVSDKLTEEDLSVLKQLNQGKDFNYPIGYWSSDKVHDKKI